MHILKVKSSHHHSNFEKKKRKHKIGKEKENHCRRLGMLILQEVATPSSVVVAPLFLVVDGQKITVLAITQGLED